MPRGSIYDIVMIDSPMTPKLVAKYPSATLTINRVRVYGMNVRVFCNCLIMTAIVSPKNKNSKASASFDT